MSTCGSATNSILRAIDFLPCFPYFRLYFTVYDLRSFRRLQIDKQCRKSVGNKVSNRNDQSLQVLDYQFRRDGRVRLIAHDSKSCVPAMAPGVQIPLPPPLLTGALRRRDVRGFSKGFEKPHSSVAERRVEDKGVEPSTS